MLSPRILIVGGGIAGLAFATALRRRGLNGELAEREPQWKPVGAGIAVQPNAMRVLHELGVGSTVDRAGSRVHRWLFRDWQGELLCDIPLKPLWGEVGPFVGIERTKLHDALLRCALPQDRSKRAAFLLCELVHTQSQLGGDKAAGASSSESAQGRL